jgi:hypothetical protein
MIAPELPLLVRALAVRLTAEPHDQVVLLVVPSAGVTWEIEVNTGHHDTVGRSGSPIPRDGSLVWRDRALMGWVHETTHSLEQRAALALRLALVRALADLQNEVAPCEGQ